MIVSYDPRKPDAKGSNFVIPLNINSKVSLFSVNTGKPVQYGLIVFVGKNISINDILNKIHFLNDITNENIQPLAKFIDNINALKVGDIIEVNSDNDLVIAPKQKKPGKEHRVP